MQMEYKFEGLLQKYNFNVEMEFFGYCENTQYLFAQNLDMNKVNFMYTCVCVVYLLVESLKQY
jgi:hypothetical protein